MSDQADFDFSDPAKYPTINLLDIPAHGVCYGCNRTVMSCDRKTTEKWLHDGPEAVRCDRCEKCLPW